MNSEVKQSVSLVRNLKPAKYKDIQTYKVKPVGREYYQVNRTLECHSRVLFLLWLRPFILSGVISPLISGIILGTYRPGEFMFQCPIFLPFHTFHGVLKARILKWFAIPVSSGPCFVRPLHHDPSVLGGPL